MNTVYAETHQSSTRRLMLCFVLALTVIVLIPDVSHAVASPMGSVLCKIILIAYGNFGRALATLAVISLGVGAMLGKVSWGLALTVATGISVVFSADAIVTALIGVPVIGC